MMNEKSKKIIQLIFKVIVCVFAIFGFGLSVSYLAIVKQWTNESGSTDMNNRKFEEVSGDISNSHNDSLQSTYSPAKAAQITYKLMVLNKYFPENAKVIIDALQKTGDFDLANKMIQAVNIKTFDSLNLDKEFTKNNEIFDQYNNNYQNPRNAFEWSSLGEWNSLKESIKKDKALIDSAGKMLGIEPRLIATVLIGEQIRLFNSGREMYKTVLMPLKILSVSSMISFGVTGIKEQTAREVERNLRDINSQFYLGKNLENLIVFKTTNPDAERMANLIDYKNHYYSYLYAGLIIRQIREQWIRAGYDISYRPEVLATLFNVGFNSSKPKPNPVVGGSHVEVGGRNYTFGGIAFEFYYSGELMDCFPYEKEKWKELSKLAIF